MAKQSSTTHKPVTKPNVPSHTSAASQSHARLPSVIALTKTASQQLWQDKRLFTAIVLVYGALNLLLVQGLSSSAAILDLKQASLTAGNNVISASLAGFPGLLNTSGSNSTTSAGVYELCLLVITSLAIIWALRQTAAGATIRMRDAYYRGMYPLIPFLLVTLVIGLELLPLIIGTSVYAQLINSGIATTGLEQTIGAIMAVGLAVISLYLVTSSIIALYIVTLQDMTPLKALRSARQLVRGRRWTVLRKLLFLPLLFLLAVVIIMLPTIAIAAVAAPWVFFMLGLVGLVVGHAYAYSLYRGLLNE